MTQTARESFRTEHDAIGEISLPHDCLYGIQTARACVNFPISRRLVRHELIHAIIMVKWAAVQAHAELSLLPEEKSSSLSRSCQCLIESPLFGESSSHEERAFSAPISGLSYSYSMLFPVDALQGGAGTSTHMNVNEVLSNLALIQMNHQPGEYAYLHPLDDVNLSQSTNDVYPTALRVASIYAVRKLSTSLSELQESLQRKEREYADIPKLGRTQLMDAVPITLGEEFGAFAQAIARDRWRIYKVEERLRQMNIGGTAVGTGTNANRKYPYVVTEKLQEITGLGLARAEYPMDLTQNCDVFVEVSGLLKACAVNLIKISGDLRLMNSGPQGGLGEISLENRQAGSTIMAGKVNPVIAEAVGQTAMQVIANDHAITIAAMSGQFELNAFLPLIADRLLDSLSILNNVVSLFCRYAIDTLQPNRDACLSHLSASTVQTTLLVPEIGYEAAAKIRAIAESSGRPLYDVAEELAGLSPDILDKLLNRPTKILPNP